MKGLGSQESTGQGGQCGTDCVQGLREVVRGDWGDRLSLPNEIICENYFFENY